MISRRILSLITDFVGSLLPAVGLSWGGNIDIIISFSITYFLTQIGELIFMKGKTVGMMLWRVEPHLKETNAGLLRLVFYHTILTVMISHLLYPYVEISTIGLTIIMVIPLKISGRCASVFDLLFSLHWTIRTEISK